MGLFDKVDDVFKVGAILPGLLAPGLDYFSGKEANQANLQAAQRNYEMQKEFAQHGIRWRVDDARAAGIHPLAALGAPAYSPSASFVGDYGRANKYSAISDLSRNLGQDISRAVGKTRTMAERQEYIDSLRMEGLRLDNEHRGLLNYKLREEINNPAMPGGDTDNGIIDGQGVQIVPNRRVASPKNQLEREAGDTSDVGLVKTHYGWVILPSEQTKDRIEDSLYEWEHFWRNRVYPGLSGKPPTFPSKKEYEYARKRGNMLVFSKLHGWTEKPLRKNERIYEELKRKGMFKKWKKDYINWINKE